MREFYNPKSYFIQLNQEINMAFATAGPNEYLVIGKDGKVHNRGTGIEVFLWPGMTFVLIPSTKQEAVFEMTQETKDGIPLRFKGIVIYRIIDPVTASMSFNFSNGNGLQEINALINNICLGELRAVVAGMTMNECIEQRKTILTAAVDRALREIVIDREGPSNSKWGIDLELVQVAQVFIVDTVLRKQLEAEVRNEIRSKSEQSDIHTQEEIGMAQIASNRQMQEQKLKVDKDSIRQKEELDQARLQTERRIQEQKLEAEKDAVRQKEEIDQIKLQAHRRLQKEEQEAEKEAIMLGVEKFKLEQETAKEKVETETPVRLLQIENQHTLLNHELELRQVESQIRELEVERDMLMEKARQELRKEILPMEQVPAIAESLSKVFKDSHLSFVGSENQLLSSILPLMQMISEVVKDAMPRRETDIPWKQD
jgi:flotillin